MEWEVFKQLFLKKYFSLVVQKMMRQEFMDFVQNSMTMMEHEANFTALSRFAPKMVSMETLKYEHFEHRLKATIQERLANHLYIDYRQLVTATMGVEERKNEANI